MDQHPEWQPFQDNATTVVFLNCMRACPGDLQVIMKFLVALAKLIRLQGGNSVRIVERGGLDVLVAAMQRFPQDLDLKARACFLLSLVVRFNRNLPVVPGRLLESGAVAQVLLAMSQFRQSGDPSHTDDLAQCAMFLAPAADEKGIPEEIVARNGVFEIVAEMHCLPDDRDIVHAGMYCLCRISDCGQHDDILLNDGALGVAVAAVERFQRDPVILKYSCMMIHDLSDPQRGRGRMPVEEGDIDVEALVSALQAAEHHPEDPDFVRRSMEAFSGRGIMLVEGGDIEALVSAIQAAMHQLEDPVPVGRSLEASSERGRMLVEGGAIEALVSAFQAAKHQRQDRDSVRLSLSA